MFAESNLAPFAWPSAALIFAVFFVLVFRKVIAEFLTRVKSVGRDGVSTNMPSEQKAVEQQAEAPAPKDIQDLLQSFDSPALLAQERAVFADLEKRKLDTTSPTTKVLVRHFAKLRLLLYCEYVYRLIFGSQVQFLKFLNTSGNLSEVEASAFYQRVVENHPENFVPNEPRPYFDFLVRQGLIIHQEDRYEITDNGREFLTWLVHSGVSEFRAL